MFERGDYVNLEYGEFIAHYGVKGQKWGIRRFQNKDGTLKNPFKKKKPESQTWEAKDASYLSDDELRRRITRLQQEKQYKEMTASRATKARKWIAKTAGKILVATAIGALAGVARKGYDSILKGSVDIPANAIKLDSGAIQFPKPTYNK